MTQQDSSEAEKGPFGAAVLPNLWVIFLMRILLLYACLRILRHAFCLHIVLQDWKNGKNTGFHNFYGLQYFSRHRSTGGISLLELKLEARIMSCQRICTPSIRSNTHQQRFQRLLQAGGQLKVSFGPSSTAPEAWANLAAFSSKGPTSDGRVKPDLLAPGTLQSAYSDPATGSTCSFR